MRVVVLFDLPITTDQGKKEYRQFRKYLVKSGFVMMQESVYTKLVQNDTAADILINSIRNNKPSDGLVQVIKLTAVFKNRIYSR